MERMIKSKVNLSHILLVGFLLLVTYPLCISGAAFPHRYGLHQVQDRTASVTPSYRIRFMNRTSFPSGFIFGAASSAYQVEGAWNVSGKGPSNWDNFTHTYPEKIADQSNGDFACNSYALYKEDISLLKQSNMDSYRFSIAWSRVIPTGRISDGVNEQGVKYYLDLISEVIKNGLTPSVTLFHWDVPQGLEDEYGGFLSPKIVNDYRNYVDLCFRRFGHLVKHWITFNEPSSFSQNGYDNGAFAPGRCSSYVNPNCTGGDSSTEPYITAHYQLLSHSAAVKLYRQKYQADQKGKIGITLVSTWTVPYNNTSANRIAAARALDFGLGWFMDPVVFGHYPLSMQRLVGKRLPQFNATQANELKQSFDFVGINYYTGYYIIDNNSSYTTNFSYSNDGRVIFTFVSPNGSLIGAQAGSTWLHVYPIGIWKLLRYIKLKYNNPTLYITENGVDEINNSTLTLQESLTDPFRVAYYYKHLSHVLKAINKSNCSVAGYYAWSIMDNFEWAAGYTSRFGIIFVDYNDGAKRYQKLSARWFNSFLRK